MCVPPCPEVERARAEIDNSARSATYNAGAFRFESQAGADVCGACGLLRATITGAGAGAAITVTPGAACAGVSLFAVPVLVAVAVAFGAGRLAASPSAVTILSLLWWRKSFSLPAAM